MSSGDSSSESVRAAGQPMRGKAEREGRKGQPWESEEGDPSTTEGPENGKGWLIQSTSEMGRGRGVQAQGTDSARQWLPRPLWQRPRSTSHLPPSPGGPPASSCIPASPAVGREGRCSSLQMPALLLAGPLLGGVARGRSP